jgi:beta-glucosidase/6-phospho-beta-glucosidase/beta-galactosidase
MNKSDTFQSFVLGGFECSSHRRADGRRLDLIAGTHHDRWAASDYAQLRAHGIRAMRDGIRWHLVEPTPGSYDWSSFLPMLHAAHDAGVQVIWDLCHYGWPDDIDIWRPEFVDRFAHYAVEVARLIRDETGEVPIYCPINEVSFWSWAGGDKGRIHPLAYGRGWELKHQLIRATIATIELIRNIEPRSRFITAEPLINVVAHPDRPQDKEEAEAYRRAQFQTCDMLTGELWPGLGGRPEYLDIIGLNYYEKNQWYLGGENPEVIHPGSPHHRPLHDMLGEVYLRYGRPMLISETGAENDNRGPWLEAVCSEVDKALASQIPIEGVCLYPVLDYPGWDDDRHCSTGLLGMPDIHGHRPVYAPMASVLRRWQPHSRANSLRIAVDDLADTAPALSR